LVEVLARYDVFQYKNKIKPDYANVGGLEIYDPEMKGTEGFEDCDGWTEWYDEESGLDFDEYRERLESIETN
jgi:hypothetical protein